MEAFNCVGASIAVQRRTRSAQDEPLTIDKELLLRALRLRRLREQFFDKELCSDGVWDMLLDLAYAHMAGKQVSVTSLCIASGLPHATAMRWIARLCDKGAIERQADPNDRRRGLLSLSPHALRPLMSYMHRSRELLSEPLRTPSSKAA